VLAKVLKQDPNDRYARASEMSADLRILLQTLPPGPDLRVVVAGEEPGPTSGSVVAPLILDALPRITPLGAGTQSIRPSQALARRTNLAPDTATFVGRVEDLAAVGDAVKEGKRLITILGPGGTGKTRLARRYAAGRLADLLPFGGVWFCDLSEARTQQGVLHVVGVTLGIPLDQAGDEAAERIGDALTDRGRMLILLDNVEQVVEVTADIVDSWMRRAPGLQLLTTSRERLRLPFEHVVDLGPLSEEEAVGLFEERAKAVSRNFAMKEVDRPVIGEIVKRLDCLPLAVELAAARVSVMAPRKILDRLDQRFRLLAGGRRREGRRQNTLLDTIQWSWDLLAPAEQAAFAQCSVFRGGFTLEAAEQVIDLESHQGAPWTLDVIQALRDKSLLHSRTPTGLGGEVRFGMYESLREFAADQLRESGAEDVEKRHAAAMVEIGEALAPALETKEGRVARIELALEMDNLHAAFARPSTDPETSFRAALAMIPMLEASGPVELLRTILDTAIASAEREESSRLCELLLWQTKVYRHQGSREDDEGSIRAIALARDLKDTNLLARCLIERSMSLVQGGEPLEGLPPAEEALELVGPSGDPAIYGLGLYAQAYALSYAGQLKRSRSIMTEALTVFREVGNLRREANALSSIAVDDANAGHIDAAEPLIRQALTLHRRVGARSGEGMCQANLALIAAQRNNLDEADRRAKKALAIHRAHGNRMPSGATLCSLGCIEVLRGNLAQSLDHFREADRLLTESGNAFYISIARRDRALAALLLDRLEEAEESARGAVTAAESLPTQPLRPCAEAVLGAVLSVRGDLSEADTRLHFARKMLGPGGDRAEVALVHLGMAFRDLALAKQTADSDPEGAMSLLEGVRGWASRFGYSEEDFDPDGHHDSTLRITKVALDHMLAKLD
jgi:predicted ATPase